MKGKERWRPMHEICIEELSRPSGVIQGDLLRWTAIFIAGAIVPVDVIPNLTKVLEDAGRKVELETGSTVGVQHARKAIDTLKEQFREIKSGDNDGAGKQDCGMRCTEEERKG